jgi:SAM-dependent methyltransferase
MLPVMQPELEAVIVRWTGSAPYWEKHRDILRQMFSPVTEALIQDAQIATSHSILDIATGPGEPALTIASLAPHAKVFGVDPIPEMVAAARREATRLELANTHFDVAFADRLPFPDDTFDAAVSRFGIMFFPSPLNALRESARVLKPGHKLAFAVWHTTATNSFHHSLARVVDTYIDSPPPLPDALEPFRFATPGKLKNILQQAGLTSTSERLLQFKINIPLSMEDYWELRLDISDKLREKTNTLAPQKRIELIRHVFQSTSEYSTGDGISFPAEVLIVSGTTPPPE